MSSQAKKPLIIDCQVFQTAAWHRGMGKYSLALLRAMVNQPSLRKQYDPYFLFSRSIESNEEAINLIKKDIPDAQFIVANLKGPQGAFAKNSVLGIQRENKKVLNDALKEKFKDEEVAFLILSLYLDEACPVFPDTASDKLLVYYDSIPYLYPERYGSFAGFFDNFYMPHTATVYEATKLLTISKTVANDLCIMFGLPKEKIFNIDGASIPRQAEIAAEPTNLKLKDGDFILMPTGQELRKNNLRAVRAFGQFAAATGKQTKLVITSHFTDGMKEQLRDISEQVIFSGNVSEGEMAWLYEHCRFVLFPSEYEGLGLPILEAAEAVKPIVCSDISVFREMSKTAFTYFDPLDVDSIADALVDIHDNLPTKVALKTAYDALLQKYTWNNTATHTFNALQAEVLGDVVASKKKIAIFCPDPSGFSAIGKVITESHAWYSQYFDITYYFDKGINHRTIRPNPLPSLAVCMDIKDFKPGDENQYEALIYHIGNSEYHANIIHIALAVPGYVILHDTYLNGAYDSLMELNYVTAERVRFEDKLDKLLPDNDRSGAPRSRDLTSLVNNQRAIITHSKYAKNAVNKKLIAGKVNVRKINLPVDVPLFPDIVQASNVKINIALAGIIAKVKGTDLLESIANLEEFEQYNITIFGYSAVEPERLEELKSLQHVKLVSNPSDHQFQSLMAGTDILLNVRQAYKGETSLTTLEAMRYGVAVIVRDFGWYSELPDDTVFKVENPSDTIQMLRDIIADSAKLKAIKENAQKHMSEEYSHRHYAEAMYKLINEVN